MDTTVTTLTFPDLLNLCESGRAVEALAAIDVLPDGPERWLIEGAALAFTEPEKAKDLLSRAADGLTGERREKALIWLSCCYWAIGEYAEASAVLDSVEPSTDGVRFIWGFTKAAYEIKTPDEALGILNDVASLLDTITNPLWRGRYFNHRGVALRKLGRTDDALIAHTEAKFWFEQSQIPRFIAIGMVNLAGVLSDVGEFEEAHEVVEDAIRAFTRLRDIEHLAQAEDQKAKIFKAQKNYVEAAKSAPVAVNLLEKGQRKELLARALITEAIALRDMVEHGEAFRRLYRAMGFAEYLNHQNLIFDVSWEIRELASAVKHTEHVRLLKIAYEEKSIRQGAKKMRIQHSAFLKAIKNNQIARSPERPSPRILNSRKK